MVELPFTLTGTVIRGKHLGTKLGFPTANIAYDSARRDWPQEGVYIGIASPDDSSRSYLAILNQGKHPTTPEGVPTVEAHLLDFPYETLYDHRLTLSYRLFLRPEHTFPSLEALQEQLKQDQADALRWAELNNPSLLPKQEGATAKWKIQP
ncbi:MAG: riboflavin kinase [Eubacteriales bacterium]|nr:riboflavin kinase [Eubacteriales bacterium]